MRYYSESQLGPTRARTPEGFLICADVPIARTGVQEYDAFEIEEVEPGDDGIIRMERPEAEVFALATIASFEGKPVTNDHPDGEMVAPGNWRKYLVGHVQNVRRGSGAQHDLLLGDLFINDPDTIDDILSGKVEVSCGYDHEVEIVGQGRGRQTQIVGNHVALVDLGRCGPRCAIGDSGMSKKAPISDWLRRAFRAKDSKELAKVVKDAETVMGEGEGGDDDDGDDAPIIEQSGEHQVHIHLAPAVGDKAKLGDKEKDDDDMASTDAVAMGKRMDALESKLGRVIDALGKIIPAGRDRGRRGDDMETEDEQDPMLEDSAHDDDDETEEEAAERKRKERESKDARGRDDFEAAPGNRSGRKILGEMEFSDPLGDRARRAAREDRSKSRREAGSRDARRSSTDSAGMRDAFDTLLADAEVIVPGVRLMSFDAGIPRAQTIDRMCAFRRRVLGAAMDDDEARALVMDVNGGEEPDLRRASCDAVKSMFGAAAAVSRRAKEVRAPSRVGGRDSGKSFIQKMQEANNKHWNAGS